jgi:membrane-bound lytic murein transglycosylase D
MFAGDWRLAVMAYNAGEYRILGALRRSGQHARNARPESLPGLSGITYAYVQKLRALSCLMVQADARAGWLDSLDRQVPVLEAQAADAPTLRDWARARGLDAAALARLNPALAQGRILRDPAVRVLAPRAATTGAPSIASAALPAGTNATTVPDDDAGSAATARAHTVRRGESAWAIARRYGMATAELLKRNDLDRRATLRPGMVLRIDAGPDE